jgi:hypothetical protein
MQPTCLLSKPYFGHHLSFVWKWIVQVPRSASLDLLFTTIFWHYQGWLLLTDEEIKCMLAGSVSLLF